MTYGEYIEAYIKISEEANLPTQEQQAQFAARNITLQDANRLRKDFHQYETVLAQDDALLKEYLEGKIINKNPFAWRNQTKGFLYYRFAYLISIVSPSIVTVAPSISKRSAGT